MSMHHKWVCILHWLDMRENNETAKHISFGQAYKRKNTNFIYYEPVFTFTQSKK